MVSKAGSGDPQVTSEGSNEVRSRKRHSFLPRFVSIFLALPPVFGRKQSSYESKIKSCLRRAFINPATEQLKLYLKCSGWLNKTCW